MSIRPAPTSSNAWPSRPSGNRRPLARRALGSNSAARGGQGRRDRNAKHARWGRVWFDPIGLWVEPGTKVVWINRANVHTSTAYHPDNAKRSLRIPEDAAPWDSGYLVDPGERFEVILCVPGVYDYCCAPHEHGGMVGRIVAGMPTGPGARPFGYFRTGATPPQWEEPPPAAQENFPPISRIMAEGRVRAPAS